MTTKQPSKTVTEEERRPAHSRSGSKNLPRRNNNNGNNGNNNNGNNNNGNNNNGPNVPFDIFNNAEFQESSNDRFLYLIFNSIGSHVKVLTNSGFHVSGVLKSIDPKTLKVLLKVDNESNITLINFEDLIEVEIENLNLFNKVEPVKKQQTFRTDVDISSDVKVQQRRDIEKWVPETDTGISLESLTVEDGASKNWDQFQTNEEKFGIKSEFDENLYTTKIDKSDPKYQQYVEEADRLAREIEGESFNDNYHLAEERGLKFDDSGIDEEDKYSGVDRKAASPTPSSNSASKSDALFDSLMNKGSKSGFQFHAASQDEKSKYVPPSHRSRLQNIDPAIVSASSLQKSVETKASPTIEPKIEPKLEPKSEPKDEQKVEPKLESKTESKTDSKVETKVEPKVEVKSEPTIGKKSPVAPVSKPTPSTIPAKPIVSQRDSKSKKYNSKNEINSLREFSQNFKLPSKFPEDLLPIVAKDKQKQEEIIKKSEANTKPKVEVKPASTSATQTPSPITTQTTASSSSSSKPTPLKPSSVSNEPSSPTKSPVKPNTPLTTKTKFNPKTASFTPSFQPTSINSPISSLSSPHMAKNSPRLNQPNLKKRYTHTPASFFPAHKLPNLEKSRLFNDDDFNFFKGCLNNYKKSGKTDPFYLERPFTTPPIWNSPHQPEDFEKPYKSLFPDQDTFRQQHLPIPQGIPPMGAPGYLPPPPQHLPQQYPVHQQRFMQPIQPLHHHPQAMYQQPFQPIPIIQQGGYYPPPQAGSNGGPPFPDQSPQLYQQRLAGVPQRYPNGGYVNYNVPRSNGSYGRH